METNLIDEVYHTTSKQRCCDVALTFQTSFHRPTSFSNIMTGWLGLDSIKYLVYEIVEVRLVSINMPICVNAI